MNSLPSVMAIVIALARSFAGFVQLVLVAALAGRSEINTEQKSALSIAASLMRPIHNQLSQSTPYSSTHKHPIPPQILP
jgi:hypothetical protein